ncbi:MAG: 2Fe-2S iron-sulfur cluster binding domain-containing protein [Lentisphaerae bacterium]|nr:2Fe-2S iron-sulfur cluster binding domain-containing protein [Lentisphaerota bacterium]
MIPFLIAVGVMCAITSLLAVIMVIADATIGNYGDVTITINGEKSVTVEGGHPLLSTLKEEEIFIPSACGGRGSCGLCKLKVLEGAGEPLPTEMPWLDPDEVASHVRLSCQVKVKNDIRIEVPEELFSVKQFETEVKAIRDLTHDIKEVRLKLIEPEGIEFTAGQFVHFEVPVYALTDEPVYRAYSLSSGPTEHGEIELEIRYVANGICTTYVHQHLEVGQNITINGPYGDFYLRDTDSDIIFIAGGSGMAPIKSILHEMARTGSQRKARYFFGARSVRDLFLLDDMKALEEQLPDFRFIPALSDPDPEDHWEDETGLITQVVGRHVEDASQMEAYLCGSPLMIDACIAVLREKGMPEEKVYFDKFS